MELRGTKVILRDWKNADLPLFRAAFVTNTAWLNWDAPYLPPTTPTQLDPMIAAKEEIIRGGAPVPRTDLAIASLASDTLIGRVSRYWQCEETQWLSVGIALFSAHNWGAGLGYQALGLWCDHLFAAMPAVARLDLRTWSGNRRMMRLATRLGFLEEGRFRNARIVDGSHYDALGYGILREEWRARFPGGFGHTLDHTG